LLVTLSLRHVVCVDAEGGKVLWTFYKKTRYDANCATPVYYDGGIFHTNPTGSGGVFLRLIVEPDSVRARKQWDCRMDNISGGAVAPDGLIYGSGHVGTGWACMDARTGEEKYNVKSMAQGSLIYADGRLYCLSERGLAALVRAGPEHDVLGRFQLVQRRCRDAWAHPVILDGRLYLRYHEHLYCYDIRRPGAASLSPAAAEH
jgi:outer membrane protein assembly factor BamB